MKEVQLVITGRVQGVNFRAMTQHKAKVLKLVGQVKNQRDGNVTAIIQGLKKDIQTLIEWMKTNPGVSHIETITEKWHTSKKHYKTFTIQRESNIFADQTQSIRNLGKQLLS